MGFGHLAASLGAASEKMNLTALKLALAQSDYKGETAGDAAQTLRRSPDTSQPEPPIVPVVRHESETLVRWRNVTGETGATRRVTEVATL